MGFWHIATEAAVVFGGWSYVPAVFSMKSRRGALSGFVVDYHFGAGGKQGVLIEVVGPMEVCLCRERGVDMGGAE